MVYAIIALLISIPSFGQSLETIFRARGLEGEAAVKEFRNKKKLTPKEDCEMRLEKSFSMLNSTEPLLIQKQEKTVSFMLPLFNEKNQASILAFTYQIEGSVPWMVAPVFDPREGFNFTIVTGRPQGSFVVSDSKCTFNFYAKDYLHPEVEANAPASKAKKDSHPTN